MAGFEPAKTSSANCGFGKYIAIVPLPGLALAPMIAQLLSGTILFVNAKPGIATPEAFWSDAARAVTWTREPTRILDDTNLPFYRWFPDGELNTCANALDRHVHLRRAAYGGASYD